jgi:hypothetical protein
MTCVDNLLTPEECVELISRLDNESSLEKVERAHMATYSRNILVDEKLADSLYTKLKPLLPPSIKTVRCNEVFRFSKYVPGEEFGIHRDGINQDRFGNRAKFTVNIFLSADFKGGETDFFDEARTHVFRAVPAVGRGGVFDREILHCGNKVLEGTKYLIRTDVMVGDGL